MTQAAERLADWARREAGIAGVQIVRTLTGGNSNVTSLVESARGPLILRHPPTDTISDLASAGIAREFRFLGALHGKAPVAEPVAFCSDRAVIGAPFSLTGFVAGDAITDTLPAGQDDSPEGVSALGHALIDALASVHAIEPVPDGLGDAGKAAGFVLRQIERWRAVRADAAVRDLPLIEHVGRWLAENAPTPEAIRIVHCDYHLDNVLMAPAQPRVNAILDWEMATLADPLVDLGLVTALWNRDEGVPIGFPHIQRVSNRAGVVSGDDLAARWSGKTGLSIDRIGYYRAFALWRLAAIVEGAYVLYRRGQIDGDYERGLEHDVPALLAAAEAIARAEGMK
ncbi:phosphotransferase family protein [Croceicoccus sp. BE223]|uniref:phosphotransferase family protein n=1 Tax=Croceicoccus sp. BE223 TaxID=2817716 RepID=UPI0028627CDC|nr:phosphotransferase family protein [Croceicoccus sp. BE223]MDR7101118.1 aminoglycoside phosphotransferase (APT) family kinase protein [Croceicoccus sp. BE223]